MKVNNLDEYEANATMLSQIEGWREKATRRFRANLIDEQQLTNCMRWLDTLEDNYESAELSLIGLHEEERFGNCWISSPRVKKYNWPIKHNTNGLGTYRAK